MTDTVQDFSDFPVPNTNLTGNDKTEARMLAVQAIYQHQLMKEMPFEDVLREFVVYHLDAHKANKEIFSTIIHEVQENQERFETLISQHIDERWSWNRLGLVEQSILLATVAELSSRIDVDAPVILNEFVNISKGFVGEKDSKFINGILNAVARKVRPTEFTE